MGQLVVKFKEWREKLELSHEKAKHVSSRNSPAEQKSLTSEDALNLNRDYGATQETKPLLPSDELSTKLDMLERVLENQKNFLEDHDAKIQEIENVIRKLLVVQEEKQKQSEPDVKFSQDAVFHDFHVDEEQAESRDPWSRFEHHAQTLKSHEERLEKNTTKIEIIREMLEDTKGDQQNEGLKQKLCEYKQQLKKQRESYERLKKEVEEQLQIQQKLQDNMLAGFIVGFVILVMICMLPRTLLTSG